MKLSTAAQLLFAITTFSVAQAAPDAATLSHKLAVTPEIKKTFQGSDAVEFQEITGTSTTFQVGGTYRIKGVCRQQSLEHAFLYIGNTAEPGADAITPLAGSSLYKMLPNGMTAFDCTFTLLRPGILHVTIYDSDNHDGHDTAYEGVYLGDVVFKH